LFLGGAAATAIAQIVAKQDLPLWSTAVWCISLTLVWALPPSPGARLNRYAACAAALTSAGAMAYQASIHGGLAGPACVYLLVFPVLYLVVIPDDPWVTGTASAGSIAGVIALSVGAADGSAVLVAMVDVLLLAAIAMGSTLVYRNERRRELQLEIDRNQALSELAVSERLRARTASVAELGLLAADVGHELKNHVTVVRGNLEFLAESVDPTLAEAVDDALVGATRMEEIARDLHTVSRPSGAEPAVVDLADVVEIAVRMARPAINAVGRVDVDLGATSPIQGDLGRLSQAVLNLLINAAQALPSERPGTNFVGVRTWQEGDRVLLAVEDNGAGIPLDSQRAIFETFYTTKTHGGTGLGLPIVRRVVEDVGGRVLLESTPGKGTVLTLDFPAQLGEETERPVALIVDDDALVGRAIARLLRPEFEVVVVHSAAEALHAVRQRHFDIVLTDVVMPGMTGVQLFERLQETDPELADRVVFMTGRGEDDPRRPPIPLEPLRKPVRRATLLQLVRPNKGPTG